MQTSTQPYRAGRALAHSEFESLRRAMMLEHCKWDSQVGDITTLAPFPLLLRNAVWNELRQFAELLSMELLAAERELIFRPELHRKLAVPRALRRCLCKIKRIPPTPAAGRMLRFDFHWTADGWRISEVNSDVPGGYAEAWSLPQLMAEHYAGTQPLGDPAAAWVEVIAAAAGDFPSVALLAAPGFLEDQQIIAYLAERLRERPLETFLTTPEQLTWKQGRAYCGQQRIGAIVRFYQAEWLKPSRDGSLFVGGRTPVANPGWSTLTESKRFPLIWEALETPMATWRRLLPETRDPRDAPWRSDDRWLVKSAFCNTGDTVTIRTLMTTKQWAAVKRAVWLQPNQWIAQRRFEVVAIDSPVGPIHPTIGVYTLDGKSVGAYGRFSVAPLIDYAASDVAILLEGDDG